MIKIMKPSKLKYIAKLYSVCVERCATKLKNINFQNFKKRNLNVYYGIRHMGTSNNGKY